MEPCEDSNHAEHTTAFYRYRRMNPRLLRPGRNVLAIQGLNRSKDSSDLSLIPVLSCRVPRDPKMDRRRFEKSISALKEKGSAERLAYLEGRLLEREGKYREAAAKLEGILTKDATRPEPYLRLAECFRALGQPEAAREWARKARQAQ